MDEADEGGCDDHEDEIDCPICAGRMSDEFIEMLKAAGTAEMSPPMTREEFFAWLDRLDVGSSHPG